jgi:hypothetical protein
MCNAVSSSLHVYLADNMTHDSEIEGLDEGGSGSGWGDYPLDSVFVRSETRSVSDAIRRIDANRYVLDPDFQRDFVWPEDKQSKLIESCVMRIPLPVFYLAEAADGRIIVVDGLQRLTTFQRYVKNHFALKGLTASEDSESPHALEGKRFNDLPLNLQERIFDTQLITYILDSKAPERARLDIFERVNSGVPLTRQQMRNALYSGQATRWLKHASELPEFLAATGRSLDRKTMRDREAINRFCAFTMLGWKEYRGGDMDGFLATSLTRLNAATDASREKLLNVFSSSMRLNRKLFREHAFRKSLQFDDPAIRRNILNIALWDVCSVLLGVIASKKELSPKDIIALKKAIISLVEDTDFSVAITYSTNSRQAVHTRFEMATQALSRAMS